MLSFIINVVLLVLVLGLLIFIHELGHFIAAKLANVRVDAFAIGMGPKLISRTRGETEYMLNAFPIGGYVSILGEVVDGDDMSTKDSKSPRNFQNKHPLVKIGILFAGVFMNLMTAVIIFFIFLAMSNFSFIYPTQVRDYEPLFGERKVELLGGLFYSELTDEGGAMAAKWPEQGYIVAMGDTEADLFTVTTFSEFSDYLAGQKNSEVYVEICKKEDTNCDVYISSVSPEGHVGILLNSNEVEIVQYTGIERWFAGFVHAINMIHLGGLHIGNIFADASESGDYSEAVNTFSGPVGLYFIVDFLKKIGFLGILDLIANLSLTLFVINLLPIPALDGGRIVLVLTEWVLGEKFNKTIESWLIRISFAALMLLMVLILIKDFFYLDKLRELFS